MAKLTSTLFYFEIMISVRLNIFLKAEIKQSKPWYAYYNLILNEINLKYNSIGNLNLSATIPF